MSLAIDSKLLIGSILKFLKAFLVLFLSTLSISFVSFDENHFKDSNDVNRFILFCSTLSISFVAFI